MKKEHREDNKHIGTHVISDMWECDFNPTADVLVEKLINAAHVSHAQILGTLSHQFEPEGATAILLLAESHISAHTWPEYGYIAVDIFTCGKNMKPQLAIDYLEKAFKPQSVDTNLIRRGIENAR